MLGSTSYLFQGLQNKKRLLSKCTQKLTTVLTKSKGTLWKKELGFSEIVPVAFELLDSTTSGTSENIFLSNGIF